MKNLFKKAFLFTMVALLILTCLTGCKSSSNVVFHLDGTFDYSVTGGGYYDVIGSAIAGSAGEVDDLQIKEAVNQFVDGWETELEQYGEAVKVEEVEEENFSGLKFTINCDSAQTLDESEISEFVYEYIQYAPTVGGTENSDLQIVSSKNFLYKTYQIKGVIPDFSSRVAMDGEMETIGLPYEVQFTATAPFKFLTKAEGATVQGNTYVWSANKETGECHVFFETTIPSVWGLCLAGLFLLLIVALIVMLIIFIVRVIKKKRKAANESENFVAEPVAEEYTAQEFYQEEEQKDESQCDQNDKIDDDDLTEESTTGEE